MKRLTLAVLPIAILLSVAWPLAEDARRSSRPGMSLCDHMTPARILENPALASEWAQALRSSEPGELARVRAMLEEIRAAHGCTGEVALPEGTRLPPGHPPIPESRPGLPPGHPPVLPSPGTPLFSTPGVVLI